MNNINAYDLVPVFKKSKKADISTTCDNNILDLCIKKNDHAITR